MAYFSYIKQWAKLFLFGQAGCTQYMLFINQLNKHVTLQEEDRASMPLLMICPAGEILSFQKLFSENDYFGFDSEKVSAHLMFYH